MPRLVPLVKGSKEYVYVEQLALRQQYQGKGWVKGKMKVNGIQRVQSPHIWEQYAMRRSIIAAENGGDSAERMLWHGTTKSDLIIKYGFDPRVCSMKGMFGGGVYYALLCRVALGDCLIEKNFRGNGPGQFWHARRREPCAHLRPFEKRFPLSRPDREA